MATSSVTQKGINAPEAAMPMPLKAAAIMDRTFIFYILEAQKYNYFSNKKGEKQMPLSFYKMCKNSITVCCP